MADGLFNLTMPYMAFSLFLGTYAVGAVICLIVTRLAGEGARKDLQGAPAKMKFFAAVRSRLEAGFLALSFWVPSNVT